MAYPTLYEITYSYTGFQQAQGNNIFPGTQLDADLEGISSTMDNLAAFMQTVIRSDGALNNGAVTYDSLSPALQTAGLAPASPWLTAVAFAVGNSVVQNSALYRCLVAHTSGVFATDLAAGKWLFISNMPAGTGYGGSSTTSLSIANTVTRVFTTQAGLAYQVGNYVRASSAANGANFMEGLVSSYVGTSLSIGVTKIGGAGTFADWNLATSGVPGAGDLFSASNLSDLSNAATARTNLGVPGLTTANTFTVASATATAVGPNGVTNPTWAVDTSTASAATGLLLKAAAAGAGVALTVQSSGANEALYVNAKGTGQLTFCNLSSSGIFVGSRTPTGDDCGVLVGRGLSPGSGLLNSHAFRDETVGSQNVTGSAFSGYASFDSAVNVGGSCTTPMNHMRAFQARPTYNSTGTVNELAGLWVGMAATNGSAPSVYGVHITNLSLSGGAVSANQYAFYSDVLSGATANYFLFQGGAGNLSVLPGGLLLGGRTVPVGVEVENISYSSLTQLGLVFSDTNAGAGGTIVSFQKSAAILGTIAFNSTTGVLYNNTSDERLKNFTGAYDPKEAIRIIRADPVREFTWKRDGTPDVGWGAQTSYAVSRELASPGDDDATKSEGDEGFEAWGIDRGKRTPYLWAAMTDVLNRLDALEGKTA